MRWPWQRSVSQDSLVFSWCSGVFSYVCARANASGVFEVIQMGVERQGGEGEEAFLKHLQSLGLKGPQAVVMLRTEQYQLLQVDTPNVPPEELRAAARYQVRDMLKSHVDDVTIDVMRLGDGQQKGTGGNHSYVVAATNAVVKKVVDFASALDCTVSVIDIQETTQRNLQTELARRKGTLERASAALVLVAGEQALLTISANEEIFYTRRFDVPEGFLTATWAQGVSVAAPIDGFTPVQEYVPSYSVGDISLDGDFSGDAVGIGSSAVSAPAVEDLSQRLVLEMQRSLDVWDRTWSSLPLSVLRVFAGERSDELAAWLTQQLGQVVVPLDVKPVFTGLDAVSASDLAHCLPLLGVLLRTERTVL